MYEIFYRFNIHCHFKFFFVACKKDNANDKGGVSALIAGTWELEQTQTGMIPAISYPPVN